MIFRFCLAQLVAATIGVLMLAQSANAEGMYQQTKDGKTMVWNSDPRPGDTAAWVGDRNKEGYAHGFGTLTWYTSKGDIYARYYGNMVDGKLDGPVNAHSKGKTAHANFKDGKRTTSWAMGTATLRGGSTDREPFHLFGHEKPLTATASPAPAEQPEKRAQPIPVAAQSPKPSPPPAPENAEPKKSSSHPPVVTASPSSARPAPEMFPVPSPTTTAKKDVEPALQSLVGPPSSLGSLHRNDAAESGGNTPLSEKEVVDLANTVARSRGYDPANYREPDVSHNEQENTWSLSYQAREDAGSETKPLKVYVDGKTKRASLAPGD